MANDQAALNEAAESLTPTVTRKQKFIEWVKRRFKLAITMPGRMNQAAVAIFYAGLCVEMALTIPGIPTGIGIWFDYLVFGLGYMLAAAIIYVVIGFVLSFFYLRHVAGWLTGLAAVTVQSCIILQRSNWGWKATGLMTALILAILIILALFVSYLHAYKRKSPARIAAIVAALMLLVAVGLAGKSYWNDARQQSYLAQYSALLLQDVALADKAEHGADGASSDADVDTDAQADDHAADDASDAGDSLADEQEPEARAVQLQTLTDNLAEQGSYSYRHYHYSSDAAWQEDDDDSTLYMTPTDGSTLLKDWSWTKEQFWGFTEQEIPVKGQLWVPEGEGPFPIVFIMHGNHLSEEDSSDGYQYLGELLASQGMIVSSIDANFLNYSVWSGIVDDDQLLRSWLMLAHIAKLYEEGRQLQADWNNVALIGHSRGGQAASMAVDARKWIADEAVTAILDEIEIKAVIAIAPTDYTVDSKLPYLTNVNYLTLHGTMDSDLTESFGERQYERTNFTRSGHFKATVELYHGNHGQFNTVWGKYDEQFPGALALNTADLMSGEDQRLAAKLFIHSFLQASFTGEARYETVFQDFRTIGEFLPLTGYVSRYYSSNTKLWYDFERPQQAEELVASDETMMVTSIDLKGRSRGDKKNRVLFVSWQQPESELIFPVKQQRTSNQHHAVGAIVVSLARAESLKVTEEEQDEASDQAATDQTSTQAGSSSDAPNSTAGNSASDTLDNARKEQNRQGQEAGGPLPAESEQGSTEPETDEATSNEASATSAEQEPYTGLQLMLKLKGKQWGTETIDLEPYFHILQPAAHDFTKLGWLEQSIKKGKYDVEIEPLLQTYVIPVSLIEQQHPRDGSLFASDMESISFIFKQDQGSVIIDALGYITEGGTYVEYRR